MNYRRLFIEGSCVFLTVVTYDRKKILIENIELLKYSFENVKKYFNFEIIAVVVLPDHFHILLKPEKITDYPKIITSIKFYFSKRFNAVGQECPTYKRNKNIWQKRYHEHTIRNDDDLNNHLDYIHYNPVKHEQTNNVKDWKYSSFHKFVKSKNYDLNWGSTNDVEKINELNYE